VIFYFREKTIVATCGRMVNKYYVLTLGPQLFGLRFVGSPARMNDVTLYTIHTNTRSRLCLKLHTARPLSFSIYIDLGVFMSIVGSSCYLFKKIFSRIYPVTYKRNK